MIGLRCGRTVDGKGSTNGKPWLLTFSVFCVPRKELSLRPVLMRSSILGSENNNLQPDLRFEEIIRLHYLMSLT